ncbi:hypothetical protein NXG62_08770 [Megasphaera sueciensis]
MISIDMQAMYYLVMIFSIVRKILIDTDHALEERIDGVTIFGAKLTTYS